MTRNLRTCAVLSLTCAGIIFRAGFAGADDAEVERALTCERKLTREEFRVFALQNSPLVAEFEGEHAKELARAVDARTLQNPELDAERTFTTMELEGAHDPQTQLSLSQPFRFSHFGARTRFAELIAKSGDVQKRARLFEFGQKLIVQFETLSAIQQTQELIQSAEVRAAEKVKLIRAGVKKGLLSEGDEKLFEGEQYRLQAQRKATSYSAAMLQSDLSKTLGLPCGVVATPARSSNPIPSVGELLRKASESEFSEGARISILTRVTKEQARVAQLDAFPSLTPRLIYQHTNDGGDFFGAGITVPLPFWNTNQGERKRATAELDVAEARARFLAEGGLEHQVFNLRVAAVSAHEQATIFATKVVPSFEAALRAQEKLYNEGKGSVLQVWQTLRAFNEVQAQSLELWLQAVTARGELSILIGEEI